MKFVGVVIITVMLLLYSKTTQACNPSPTPPPPPTSPPVQPPIQSGCPNIPASDSVDGSVPLYGANSGGIHKYLIVLNNDDTDCAEITQQIMTSLRYDTSMKAIESRGGINVVVCDLDSEQLKEIRKMKCVRYVEKDEVVTVSEFTDVWGLDRIDQQPLPLNSNYSPTGNGAGTFVYVIDSGVNTQHTLFSGRAEAWHEEVTNVNDEDCTGHGTHVAGTIAALTYGVAKQVSIRSVRVFNCSDSTTISTIVSAINFILDNADSDSVVSMSLGGPMSVTLDEAVTKLVDAGFIVVVAAGNQIIDACERSPARVPGTITVGSTDRWDRRAAFSNFGPAVDMFAPGVDVVSLDYRTNSGTRLLSGTSMSVPHVSGVAAILLARGIPAAQVPQKIYDLSTKNVVRDSKGSNNRLLYID